MVQGGGSSCLSTKAVPQWAICICKREHVRRLRIFIGPSSNQTPVTTTKEAFLRLLSAKGQVGCFDMG